jgi:hypothetical protein
MERKKTKLETEFFPKAQEFIEKLKAGKAPNWKPDLTVIRPGADEWKAWAHYFRLMYGTEPATMEMVRKGSLDSVTMPCQWPWWFDSRYVAPETIPPDSPLPRPPYARLPIRREWMTHTSWAAITRTGEEDSREHAERVLTAAELDSLAQIADMREESVDNDRAKRAAMWKELGARMNEARGIPAEGTWQASPELEALVREQTKARGGEPPDEGTYP